MTPEIKKALDLALEALESERPYLGPMPSKTVKAITAIKQARSTPVQEAVAMPENWFAGMPEEYRKEAWRVATVPLTDEQREEIAKGWRGRNWSVGDIIDATEAAHNITTTPKKENT
jgi:hypothetical protein